MAVGSPVHGWLKNTLNAFGQSEEVIVLGRKTQDLSPQRPPARPVSLRPRACTLCRTFDDGIELGTVVFVHVLDEDLQIQVVPVEIQLGTR